MRDSATGGSGRVPHVTDGGHRVSFGRPPLSTAGADGPSRAPNLGVQVAGAEGSPTPCPVLGRYGGYRICMQGRRFGIDM
ncbi:hypothetical protein GCM10009663_43680 [Kitasatospora arboriphila]|uniref:Uncharacterized protein n=1 Tax=Kitasatospora arboriphila TaxID=258052 RepID=A0ABN1TNL2_9ACTN